MPKFVCDLELLLAPIPGDTPAGQDLRYEGTYDRIKDARRDEDDSLSRGIWERPLKRADWNEVAAMAEESVITRSKDLQICSWLMESWIHLYGFDGAREGVRLLQGLCERYWESMYPAAEDPEYRIAVIDWVDDKLSIALKFIPLTTPIMEGQPAYSWSQWESASFQEQVLRQQAATPQKKNAKADKAAEITPLNIEQAMMNSPSALVQELYSELEEILTLSTTFDKILDSKFAKNAPSLRKFRTVVSGIRDWIHPQMAQILAMAPPSPSTTEMVAVESAPLAMAAAAGAGANSMTVTAITTAPQSSSVTQGPIRSRAEAYQRLAEAADYLQRTEPHSPTPYLVRRAIQWGDMDLKDLLPQLIRNGQVLSDVAQLLNINPAPNSEK